MARLCLSICLPPFSSPWWELWWRRPVLLPATTPVDLIPRDQYGPSPLPTRRRRSCRRVGVKVVHLSRNRYRGIATSRGLIGIRGPRAPRARYAPGIAFRRNGRVLPNDFPSSCSSPNRSFRATSFESFTADS